MKSEMYLGDCMDFMRTMPDKFFDLAICDPPYGIGKALVNGGKPVWNTSANLSSGWLDFDGIKYSFTPKMIEMLGQTWYQQS